MSNNDSGTEKVATGNSDTLVALKTLMDGEKFEPESVAIKYSDSATVGPIEVGLYDVDESEDNPGGYDPEFQWELPVGGSIVLEEADFREFENDVQVATDTTGSGQDGPVYANIGGDVTTQ